MNDPRYFEIQADDLKRAIDFYAAVFGWDFMKQDGMSSEYYHIETDGITGGLLPRPVPLAPEPGAVRGAVISMEVKDFDTASEAILKSGGKVAFPKFAIPGKCWQGYFLDTENNTFGIFQPDKKAA